MSYQVLNTFKEKKHKGTIYKKGEVYPKTGFDADPKRVAFLQGTENKYRKAFIGPELKDETSAEIDAKEEVQVDSEEKAKVDANKEAQVETEIPVEESTK